MAAGAARVGMQIGMNVDTVIVKAGHVENGQIETLCVETHAGEYLFVFPRKTVDPISLLGKRLVEAVLDLFGDDLIWHPYWCRCSGCQDVARMEAAYEADMERQWDAWFGR
ncbi:hypothetical protein Q0M94_24945 (plasmid) [Deinococcus radiomollis]|uniref:hypothetical protein n=1 Tax=Deinococcus radiomollis TaxID=468916 RepID=UPI0038922B72